jgi:16S rRNA pseudouridine516 synthase
MSATLRLDRLLANMGYGSRKDIQMLCRHGRVLLDGRPVAGADAHVPVSLELTTRMTINGLPLDPPPGFATVMMHKPLGMTCSHKEAGPLVYDLLPDRWRGRKPAVSTIGRLDKETSGLLLLTDDGGLLHRVISPKSNVSKRYQVALARPLRGDEIGILASGALLLDDDDKPLLPVEMTSSAATHATVTLREGRYHQVRRMFAAMGNHVAALHRDGVGGLELAADLQAGQWRVMTPSDITAVLDQTLLARL